MERRTSFYVDRSASSGGNGDADAGPTKGRAHQKRARGGPAWEDEDDNFGRVGTNGGAADGVDDSEGQTRTVDVSRVKRRRKLRHGPQESALSRDEYSKRLRTYFSEEAARRGAGTWAELPSQKRMPTRKRTRNIAKDGRHQTDTDESSDEEAQAEADFAELSQKVDVLAASANKLLSTKSSRALGATTLSAGSLDIRKIGIANKEDPNRSVVRALEFHPSGKIIMTAGLDQTVRLFNVDGHRCSKIQGVHLDSMPIRSASFASGGQHVILSGRRAYFYRFDLGSGTVTKVHTLERRGNAEKSLEKFVSSPDGSSLAFLGTRGRVSVVSSRTYQQVGLLRMPTLCTSAAFSRADENQIITTCNGGMVYVWDVRTYGCVDRHRDEGSLRPTCVASSPEHYAVGSDSGVVNVYKSSGLQSGSELQEQAVSAREGKPEKAILNLRTSIADITFNCDGRLMAFCSKSVKGGVRILHVPSLTVYKNWPSDRTNLRKAQCMAFSPSGGLLAIGNDQGNALLFRIRNGYPMFSEHSV